VSDETPAPRGRVVEHLANERTHLAYVRTAIVLFTFGITLHQFSQFIAEHRHGAAVVAGWRVGLGMVIFGVTLALWSAYRFDVVTRQIDGGTYRPSRLAMMLLSLVVLLLGAASTIWLLWR
jgi:putative membrane protein